jgi:hypothetical protein
VLLAQGRKLPFEKDDELCALILGLDVLSASRCELVMRACVLAFGRGLRSYILLSLTLFPSRADKMLPSKVKKKEKEKEKRHLK